VLMRGPAAGVLWAVSSASGANEADVALGGGDGVGKAQLDGFRTRVLSSAATTARKHMYQTVWHEVVGGSSAGAGAILLLGSSGDLDVLRLNSAPQALLASERPVIVVTTTESLLPLPALAMALRLVSSMTGSQAAPLTVWLLSVSLAASSARSAVGVATAGPWGLARAARAELPSLPLGCASSDGSASTAWPWVLAVGEAPSDEPELEWSSGGVKVPRLAQAVVAAVESVPRVGGGQLLTGGTGGLGLLTARWLGESRGAPALVLASRSGALARGSTAEWALLGASGAAVRIARCDAADPAAVRRLLAWSAGVAAAAAPRLCGVWHAAGVLSDALLPRQTAATLARVYGPKAHGAWALQRCTAALPLEACALFSSVAALLGGPGQVGAIYRLSMGPPRGGL